MKKSQFILLLVLLLILLSSFKKNENKISFGSITTGISIANANIVEGNIGQRTVDVMVILSQPAIGPVTVTYNTRDGSASAGSDYIAVNGTVGFVAGEKMKKISVQIIGDIACEGNETFEIVLSNATGANLSNNVSAVSIINDDCIKITTYEVKLTFSGYTTLYVGPPDCPIRSNGEVILSGLVSGNEMVNTDDDINYTGVLQLDIDIDICSAKRVAGEDQFCGMTVIGSGTVTTELELYFNGPGQDSARGGYIKIEDKSGQFVKMVSGSCDKEEMKEEQDMVPNKTIASIFNGYELSMLKTRTLRIGRYVLTGDAGVTTVEVLRKIQ